LFFGRQREAGELLRLVKRSVLTVVFGPSGTGKTSLLNAGLFPLLRQEGYLPIAVRLDHSSAGHVADVRHLMARALEAHDIEEDRRWEPPPPPERETLWEYLHHVDFWDKRNQPVTPVLVFDQFEEVFTLGPTAFIEMKVANSGSRSAPGLPRPPSVGGTSPIGRLPHAGVPDGRIVVAALGEAAHDPRLYLRNDLEEDETRGRVYAAPNAT
jgi:AAA ATPase domain